MRSPTSSGCCSGGAARAAGVHPRDAGILVAAVCGLAGVLVPRPETEILVEAGLAAWGELRAARPARRAGGRAPRAETRESGDEALRAGSGHRGAVHRVGRGRDCLGPRTADGARRCHGPLLASAAGGAGQRRAAWGRGAGAIPPRDLWLAVNGQVPAGSADLVVANPPYIHRRKWTGSCPRSSGSRGSPWMADQTDWTWCARSSGPAPTGSVPGGSAPGDRGEPGAGGPGSGGGLRPVRAGSHPAGSGGAAPRRRGATTRNVTCAIENRQPGYGIDRLSVFLCALSLRGAGYGSTVIRGGNRSGGRWRRAGPRTPLALMAAALLSEEPLHLSNVPRLMDVRTMTRLLRHMGWRWRGMGRRI